MCGIVGYLGTNEAAPILVEALRRLEYRGYDSAGIATIFNDALHRRRAVGKLDQLSNLLVREPIRGCTGIGHTRWATHGKASVPNAHPHSTDQVAVVHNGIIENHQKIHEWLESKGYQFETETDTEAITILCQHNIDRGMAPIESVKDAIGQLQGQYAICVLFSGEENLIVAARKGSPLVIGHGNQAMFIASDALGLAGLSNRITYLHEGDLAEVYRSGTVIHDSKGKIVSRPITQVDIDQRELSKGKFKHFMLKEIFEQPERLADAISGDQDHLKALLELKNKIDLATIQHIRLVGCGTANYACQIGSYWFESIARIPAHAEIASEFRYRNAVIGKNDLSIFVSQSGETADTLAALSYVHSEGGKNIAILNNITSTMARTSDIQVSIEAGIEVGVASTKAFSCQLAKLAGLAIYTGCVNGSISQRQSIELISKLERLPGLVNAALALSDQIYELAQDIAEYSNILFIGRNLMYPTALEGALKLKEISYIHAEGLASGELKHGPIALIEKTVPTVVLAPSGALFSKTVSNLTEIRARMGPVILFSDEEGIDAIGGEAWKTVKLPKSDNLFTPILYTIPLQLLAYHTAVIKGTDVDMPRNLAKSVTVE